MSKVGKSNGTVRLKVRQADLGDVMGDIARFDKQHRTFNGKLVRAGRVVVLRANQKTERVVARGSARLEENEIALTSETRERLRMSSGADVDFTFAKANFFDEFLWAWRATNPTDRVAARLGLISVFLGFAGATLGIISAAVSFPTILTLMVTIGLLLLAALLIAVGYLWGGKQMIKSLLIANHPRHAELVSASMVGARLQRSESGRGSPWTLNRVQGDDEGNGRD